LNPGTLLAGIWIVSLVRRRNRIEYGVDGARGVRLLQARLRAHRFDKLGFVHVGFLLVGDVAACGSGAAL
jgi:hypothetical protein